MSRIVLKTGHVIDTAWERQEVLDEFTRVVNFACGVDPDTEVMLVNVGPATVNIGSVAAVVDDDDPRCMPTLVPPAEPSEVKQ